MHLGMTTKRRVATLLVLTMLAVLPACQVVGRGGSETTSPGQTQTGQGETSQPTDGPGPGGQPTDATDSTDSTGQQPGTGGQPPGSAPPGDRQPIGNLTVSPDNGACALTPSGAADGSDALQFFFYILLNGANSDQLPGLVSVSARSDSGASASSRSSVSNQAQALVTLALRQSDLGRGHTITITVDDTNEIPETDEADNTLKVGLDVPAPPRYGDLPCSMSRG
jgi:hypothetical protein